MAEQDNTNQVEATEEQVRQQVDEQARDIAATYERAKREMNEAVARLRTEIERIDVQRARMQAEDWVKDNPALATFLAVGAGILVGRLVSSALTPAPPPPLPVRARKQAELLARQARRYAGEAGSDLAKKAVAATGVIALTAKEVADVVAHRASGAAETLRESASDWSEAVTDRASDAIDALQDSAHDFSSSLRKKTKSGVDFMDTVSGAARTAVAAVLIKRVNDWIKQLT